jgi:glycosyltransferase involved in cell wall biosynthesis
MTMLSNITVVIVNHKTKDLLQRSVGSTILHYPQIKLLLIDNNSKDASTDYITALAGTVGNVVGIINSYNVGHGPAMHQALHIVKSRYVLMLDTDCEVKDTMFILRMFAYFVDSDVYAVGKLIRVNNRGIHTGDVNDEIYIRPYCMMLDRVKYLHLAPFIHHGAPCMLNFRDALAKGFKLLPFHFAGCVVHKGEGTREQHGIPGWDPFREALPEQAKTAEEMLRKLK